MRNQRGQSLFEVTVALAVVAIVLVALVGVASISVRNTSFARNKTLAARLSQETVEWLRAERDRNWVTFSERVAVPLRCLPTLSWAQAKIGACGEGDTVPGTIFRREIELSLDNDTVAAAVALSWEDGQGSHTVRVSTFFTDWRKK